MARVVTKSQGDKISVAAKYSDPRSAAGKAGGVNAPAPKVQNVSTSKAVKAKPQDGVQAGRK